MFNRFIFCAFGYRFLTVVRLFGVSQSRLDSVQSVELSLFFVFWSYILDCSSFG